MAGAFEAFGPEALKTVDAATFREAMARLGAAVHVVTTAGRAGRTGFTATAVCSVSDQPATLLVCLNRRSRGTPALRENGVFCVNTLAADGQEIADTFAGRTGAAGEERFKVGDWMTLATGAPVLRSAAVAFDCRTIDVKTVATHNVFFAVVEAVHIGEACPALVYHERSYKRV
ncbi:MAG: flavin reductase [Variibacter sp.]|nr:flavin reductase [Variibacter sp.]